VNSECHTIALLLENEAGALSRVSGLFSARAYNIESLSVAPTQDPTMSRMTVVTSGSPKVVEQIIKQLNKLVDVIKLIDLTEGGHIERELMLLKLRISEGTEMADLEQIVTAYGANFLDHSDNGCTLEVTGTSQHLNELMEALGNTNIVEMARSGVLGLQKGSESLRE
jgi:acetolactate synthase-1/3 small subunit